LNIEIGNIVGAIAKWRRTWRGPKRGLARGIAVFGAPGFEDPDALENLLSRHDELTTWAASDNLVLTQDPEGLAAIEGLLDHWYADPTIGHKLSNEVGVFLGTVIVKNVPGARWTVWPNGHPVIRLASGREMDVTALVDQRLNGNGQDLSQLFSQAARG
jgi:hypothetical protein